MRADFTELDLDAQARLKEAFDPAGIFNPAKVLPEGSRCFDFGGGEAGDTGRGLGMTGTAGDGPERVAPSSRGTGQDPQGGHGGATRRQCRRWRDETGLRIAAACCLVVEMSGIAGIEEWDPDDLTVTVGAGTPVAELESALAERAQTAVLPEVPGASTVGGVISAGVSSLRRARLLGTRERMLEVRLVTGDGRVVRGGGRVVKNVSGYDLRRFGRGCLWLS